MTPSHSFLTNWLANKSIKPMLYSTAGLQFNNTETDQKDNMFLLKVVKQLNLNQLYSDASHNSECSLANVLPSLLHLFILHV